MPRLRPSLIPFALLGVTNAPAATQTPLTFLVWEDYISTDIVEQWYEQTNAPLKEVWFDDEAQNNLILTGSGDHGIDVAIVPSSGLNVLDSSEYLYPVRKNHDQAVFWPNACGDYGQQYAWGAYGIVYREDKLRAPVTSWSALLSPSEELTGHIGMLGQPDELITSALLALNLPPASNNPDDLKKAFELLRHQASSVVTYDYIYTYVSGNPTQNDVWVAPAYSGDEFALNELQETSAWKFVLPDDGIMIWIDCLVIPSKSSSKVLAQQFIDFLSQPQISASNNEYLGAETPFKESHQLQSTHNESVRSLYENAEQWEGLVHRFSNFNGKEILQRMRIKDALMRYHDTH